MSKPWKFLGASLTQVIQANQPHGQMWGKAVETGMQKVKSIFPKVDGIKIKGSVAHQSHNVAAHSKVISAMFYDGSKKIISGHIFSDGDIEYGRPAHGASSYVASYQSEASQSTSTTDGPKWRWDEDGGYAEYSWDGEHYYKGDWSDEFQKWYTSFNSEWYYW